MKALLLQNQLPRRQLVAPAERGTHPCGGKPRKAYQPASFVMHAERTGANTRILILCASLVKNPFRPPSPGPMKSVKERRYQDRHQNGQR